MHIQILELHCAPRHLYHGHSVSLSLNFAHVVILYEARVGGEKERKRGS
jgi:hypothetical protein